MCTPCAHHVYTMRDMLEAGVESERLVKVQVR